MQNGILLRNKSYHLPLNDFIDKPLRLFDIHLNSFICIIINYFMYLLPFMHHNIKRNIATLIFFILMVTIRGQVFEQYKQSSFYFFSSTQKLKGDITANTYIKRGDSLLIISNLDKSNFLNLLEKRPVIFDSLFYKLPITSPKNAKTDKFNKILKQTIYKIHADISFPILKEDNGDKIIWYIYNSDHLTGKPACDLSILFNVKNPTDDKTTINNLEFITIINGHCHTQ